MPYSGKSGNVKWGGTPADIIDVRNWRFSKSSDTKVYQTSDTSGQKRRLSGGVDWQGQFECYDDASTTLISVMDVEDSDTLELYQNGSLKWSGTAFIESITPICNVETGDPIGVTVVFGGNGELTDLA